MPCTHHEALLNDLRRRLGVIQRYTANTLLLKKKLSKILYIGDNHDLTSMKLAVAQNLSLFYCVVPC